MEGKDVWHLTRAEVSACKLAMWNKAKRGAPSKVKASSVMVYEAGEGAGSRPHRNQDPMLRVRPPETRKVLSRSTMVRFSTDSYLPAKPRAVLKV